MRDVRLFSAVAIMLGITHAAQDSGLAGAIATLPNCALTCIGATLPTSRCSPLDQECICTDATLLLHVEGCVLSSCSMQESLATKNITMIACGAPLRRKSENTRLSNIVLSTITATIGITRLLYNATLSHIGWGSDDSLLFALLIAGAPSVVIVDRMSIPNGLGKDVWTLKLSEIEAFVRSVYALEILYFLQVALAKATLLFFFLKIFPAQRTRQLILSTLWLDALYGAIFTFVAIFSCQPIHYYWTRFARTAEGKCVDMNALVWANASISIALDVWMLVLPLYEIYGLKMSWRKRLSVALMFFVGTFVTIVSIIRLRSLITFAKGQNPTWDQADVVNWSNIEINVGIICACMPTLRAMLMRLLADHRGQRKSESPHIESHNAYRSDRSFKKDGSVDSELATIGNESLGKIIIEAQNT